MMKNEGIYGCSVTCGTKCIWILLVELMLVAGMGCQPKDVSESHGRIPYSEFPETYTLTNGRVVVVVAPQVGRIIGYHRVGEPNLLWLDVIPTLETTAHTGLKWTNYGGDKVWLAPQGLWYEILGRDSSPDTTTDGDPMTVTYYDPRKIVIVSNISPAHAARLTRTITLPDDDTTVRIENHLERVMADPNPVQVWTITQILLPRDAYLDLTEDRPWCRGSISEPAGIVFHEDHNLGAAQYVWPEKDFTKVGTFGRWVAAVYGQTIFAQYAPLDVAADYYDQANCEIFVDPKLHYMELELLSPLNYLANGETIDFTVTWKLLDRPLNANQQDVVKLIECNAPKKE